MQLQLELSDKPTFVANQDKCARLAEFFAELLPSIHLRLIRDLSFISQLAHYKEGLEIVRVDYLKDNQFQLHFKYRWHIFQGCIGMDETGEMKDKVNFTVSKTGKIEVDLSAFQALSTADEL